MKKVVASMLAMLLVLSMGTTVFAAKSPDSQAALEELAKQWDSNVSDVSAYNSNNNIVSVTRTKPTTDQVSKANSAAKQASKDAEVLGMTDLSVGKNVNTSKGIRLTFSVPGVKSTDKVYVLHQLSTGEWETLKPTSISDGQVTVTLYSFSPVAIVRYPSNVNVPVSDPTKNQTENNTNNSESNNNSHNTTGDSQNNSQTFNPNNNNSQTNNNNNNQTNNNQVDVKQNVTVNYPDKNGNYDDGYNDGYSDGKSDAKSAGKTSSYTTGTNGGSANGAVAAVGMTSPKTGASVPALPILAVAVVAGIIVCGRKAAKN
jgi:hypothetical protein